MNIAFIIGVIGSLFSVTGAAWPSPKKNTPFSVKNYLFAIANILLLIYSVLLYLQDGGIFFVLLESLIAISTVLMFINLSDKISSALLTVSGFGFAAWSVYVFESFTTLVFIAGLTILSVGYAFTSGTPRRFAALTVGSVCIAAFSYLEANWIFCLLNTFFAMFSGWYWITGGKK